MSGQRASGERVSGERASGERVSGERAGGERAGGALLVAGTGSDAGKSVVTAGLCRALARRGLRVAPFKAQNMALNSMVTADGGEIGRAQAMQAAAAGVPAEAAMNPVLLKPGAERTHVVVRGRPYADVTARSYRELKPALATVVNAALAELRGRFDVVVCEGAGSPAEVNLRADDIANMGLARAADLPVIVVGDIDRGGVFAHLAGTLAVLAAEDQRLVAGFCVNKFRGDPALLAPGLDWLAATTGRPCLGVLPWRDGLWLDVEDSLDLAHRPAAAAGGGGGPAGDVLTVAVVHLPRTSNITDLDPLAAEVGVVVRLVSESAELADADLVVLPGSRATVADLRWLTERGLAAAVTQRARAGGPVLGICGGLQILGELIDDPVESGVGVVAGLGLLPLRTTFQADKTLGLPSGAWRGHPAGGYEIRHGVSTRTGGAEFPGGEEFPGGCAAGSVYGTSWHGIFEHDGFRGAFLTEVAARRGRAWRPSGVSFAAVREARLDTLGDLVAEHLDVDAVLALAADGAPADLPVLRLATAVAAR